MNIYEKTKQLGDERGLSIYRIEKDCGFSNGSIMKWANSSPKAENVQKLADYFDVSVDYLLGRTDNPAPIIHPSNEYIPDGIIKMPVIGVISAGYDGEAVEEVIDNVGILAISLHGYSPEDCFLLRVRGDSMYPDFREGDLIVVHRQTSVDSGDVAVVLFNGDSATLKRVEYESGKDWMKLIPRNPDYQEKIIKGIELNECRILGKVISLVYREIV